MPAADPLIAPLSLSNVLTVLCALLCLWTAQPQASGGVWRLWRLATPAAFAAVATLMLFAGVFEVSWQNDAEWLAALLVGGLAGRMRGWALPVAIDQRWGLVRLPKTWDGQIAAVGVVAVSALDFAASAMEEAVIQPHFIASASALFAGFLGARAIAIIVRSTRGPHVRLHDAA